MHSGVAAVVSFILAGTAAVASETDLDTFHRHFVQRAVERALASPELSVNQRAVIEDGLRSFLSEPPQVERESSSTATQITRPTIQPSLGEIAGFRAIIDEEPESPPSPPETPQPPAGPVDDPDSEAPDGVDAAPQPVLPIGGITCFSGNELLLNGRFLVAATVTDLVGNVYAAGSCRMTNSAGYFFFFDPTNVEIPVKMLNACAGGAPATHWIFITGLTNFGVRTTFFDLLSGISLTHTNPVNTIFQSSINQQTPFPCL